MITSKHLEQGTSIDKLEAFLGDHNISPKDVLIVLPDERVEDKWLQILQEQGTFGGFIVWERYRHPHTEEIATFNYRGEGGVASDLKYAIVIDDLCSYGDAFIVTALWLEKHMPWLERHLIAPQGERVETKLSDFYLSVNGDFIGSTHEID